MYVGVSTEKNKKDKNKGKIFLTTIISKVLIFTRTIIQVILLKFLSIHDRVYFLNLKRNKIKPAWFYLTIFKISQE